MVKNSTKSGQIVCDPFLGSGSTLSPASSSAGAAGIDLDPKYVDVAVARWERFTGRTAERGKAPDLVEAEARLAAMGLGKVTL
jgi:DNA modification methylase